MSVPTAVATEPKRRTGVNSRSVKNPKLVWNEARFDDERDAAALVLGSLASRAEALLFSDEFFAAVGGRFGLDEGQTTTLVGEVLGGIVPEFFRPGPGEVERPLRLPQEVEADPQFVRAEPLAADHPEPAEGVEALTGTGEPGQSLWDRLFADGEDEVGHEPDYAFQLYSRRNACPLPQSFHHIFAGQVTDQPRFQERA